MTWFSRHPDAAALGLVALGDAADPVTLAHLANCPACQQACARIDEALDHARVGASAAADALFDSAALARQRAAILRRISKDPSAMRVLPFPLSVGRVRPAAHADRRWLAAAAGVGLLIGLAAGRIPQLTTASRPAAVARQSVPQVMVPDGDGRVDDTLLSEVDAALTAEPRPELAALDALTPVHYETR